MPVPDVVEPVLGFVAAFRIVTYDADGQRRPELSRTRYDRDANKYISPKGVGSVIYRPAADSDARWQHAEEAWLVEGEVKTIALDNLGIAALGFGGAQSWHLAGESDLHPDLARLIKPGKRINIVFDADWRTNSNVHRGLWGCMEAVRRAGGVPIVINLPTLPIPGKTGIDDLIAYWLRSGITDVKPMLAGLERLKDIPNPYTVDMKNPLHTAENFVAARFPEHSLVHWQDDFYQWTGPGYIRVADEIMTKKVYDWMEGASASPTDRKVGMIVSALRAYTQIMYAGTPVAPIFIRNVDEYPPIENLVPVRNGLLDIGTRQLLIHTPDYFNLSSSDVQFDPTATSSTWERFLESIYPDDETAAITLAEYAGYCLTTDTRYQKALALIGAPRSGKGTIQRVVQSLLGPDSYCSPTLQSLGTEFGLQTFIGKRAAFIADARTSRLFNSQLAVERLLTIIGQDTQYVNRKHKPQWEGPLGTRIWLVSNQLPATHDTGGALVTRFLMLKHAVSFLGKEDVELGDKLLAELPGILNWALAGLSRLRERGKFVQPDAGLEMISQWEALNSPMKAFVDEHCELGPTYWVPKKLLRDSFTLWCQNVGSEKAQMPEAHFTNELMSATNHAIGTAQRMVDGRDGRKKTWVFTGIGLKAGTGGTTGTSKY